MHSFPTNLDVLIVYSQSLVSSSSHTPFSASSRNVAYNQVYGYFLQSCTNHQLSSGFASSADIIGPGLCKSYWKYSQNHWKKVNHPCYSKLIFDKFSPTKKKLKLLRQLLFSSPEVKSFNDPEIFNIFFDKQKTFEVLAEHSIPTVSLNDNPHQSYQSLLDMVPQTEDFSSDLVLKDRYGSGGRHVYKYKTTQIDEMLKKVEKNKKISFILQPYLYNPQSTDVRLIFLNGKIVQTYIRVAKSGEFICNEHQGGLLTYLSVEDISSDLITKANHIIKLLGKTNSFFTLDFIVSKSGQAYLLEGNTGPGLDWNTSLKKNEFEAKKLIRLVVSELANRTKTLV